MSHPLQTAWILSLVLALPSLAPAQRVHTVSAHNGSVSDVTYSPDGTKIATAGSDGAIHLWDADKREKIATLVGHTGYVLSLAFSPDNKTLVSGGEDNTVRVWSLEKMGRLSTQPVIANVVDYLRANDGKKILRRQTDGSVSVYDLDKKTASKPWKIPDQKVTAFSWVGNGQEVVVATATKVVRYNALTGKKIDELTPATPWKKVSAVTTSADSKWLVVGTSDGKVEGYTFPSKGKVKPRWVYGAGKEVLHLQTGTRNQRVGGLSADGKTFLVDQRNGRQVLAHPVPNATSFDLSTDGRRLMVGDSNGTVFAFEERQPQPLAKWKVSDQPITQVAYDMSYRGVLAADQAGMVTTWSLPVRNRTPTAMGQQDYQRSLTALLGLPGLTYSILDTKGKGEIWWVPGLNKRDLGGHRSRINSVAFSQDGTLLASASSDKTILCWDTKTYAQKFKGPAFEGPIYSLCFTKDGKQIIAGDGKASVKLVDIPTGKNKTAKVSKELTEAEDSVYAVAVHPDGRRMFAGGLDKALRVYDLKQKKVITSWADAPDEIYGLDLNKNGKRLATIGYGGTLRVWDVAKGNVVFRHKFPVGCYAISYKPDGTQLAVGRGGGDLLIVDLPKFIR